MTSEEKYNLVRSIGEECIQEDELRNLLEKKPSPICYDGFEPSGRMHIAQGVVKAINVNKLTLAGCTVKIWIADWFAQLNNKMGGDPRIVSACLKGLENILKVGEADKNSGSSGGVNLYAQMIEEAKGLGKIENLQSHDDTAIYEKVVKMLETYWLVVEDDEANIYSYVASGQDR